MDSPISLLQGRIAYPLSKYKGEGGLLWRCLERNRRNGSNIGQLALNFVLIKSKEETKGDLR